MHVYVCTRARMCVCVRVFEHFAHKPANNSLCSPTHHTPHSCTPTAGSGLSTPAGALVDESAPLVFRKDFTNHAPFNKLFDVSCPTPLDCAKKVFSELALYIRYGFKLLGYLGLGELGQQSLRAFSLL